MDSYQINKDKITLTEIFNKSISKSLSVAIFKLPESSQIHFLADNYPLILELPLDLRLIKGFLINPFESGNQPTILIQNKVHLIFEEHSDPFIIHNELIDFENIDNSTKRWYTSDKGEETQKGNYISSVNTAIEKIHEGLIKKIVLSRGIMHPLKNDFSPISFFIKLSEMYPNAFISLTSTPETGTWIGASPEILMQINAQNIFKTVALAGTKISENNALVSQAVWSQKEIEEQALVSRFIVNCFKKIRVREFEEYGPKTIQTGHLLHLKTEYTADLNVIEFDNLSSVMLDLLHPTSAVCGTPKEVALHLIKEYEFTAREYYSGYLGPVNFLTDKSDNEKLETHLYVNIRCLQLIENEAIIYAGAGITEDSDAEKEFEETEQKLNAVIFALNSLS